MIKIIPAVDIKNGKCVRLIQGKADQETVYSDDPVAMAFPVGQIYAQEGTNNGGQWGKYRDLFGQRVEPCVAINWEKHEGPCTIGGHGNYHSRFGRLGGEHTCLRPRFGRFQCQPCGRRICGDREGKIQHQKANFACERRIRIRKRRIRIRR